MSQGHDPRSDELDDQMRELLRERADGAPRVDLTDAWWRRAGRIRLRRRVAAGAAALAVAAVVVPAGIGLVDPGSDSHLADRTNTDDVSTTASGTPTAARATAI